VNIVVDREGKGAWRRRDDGKSWRFVTSTGTELATIVKEDNRENTYDMAIVGYCECGEGVICRFRGHPFLRV
jgi:hypothetical protein